MGLSRQEVVFAGLGTFFCWHTTIYWLPSLRFVPIAFLAGFLTAVGGFAYILFTTSRGTQHAQPPLPQPITLYFTSTQNWKAEVKALERRTTYVRPIIWDGSTSISARISAIVEYVLRDFVKSWYIKISLGSSFTNEVDRAIRIAIRNILLSASKLDTPDFVVTRVLPIVNGHLKAFAEAERQVRGRDLNLTVTESEELDVAIASKYRDGRVHPAASLGPSKTNALQQEHMRRLVQKLVNEILPENMTSSAAVLVLIREILACAVLQPVMQALSDPDVINQIVEGYGRSVISERKNVRKLRAALEAHATPVAKRPTARGILHLDVADSEKTYEKFIRSIRQSNSLSEARRSHAEVLRQIKTESVVVNQDQTYLRRLQLGRGLLEQKITDLSSESPIKPRKGRSNSADASGAPISKMDINSLKQCLYDASGLSYFMEYMDRQGLMALVQFWVVVDGLRDPLEDIIHSPESLMWSKTDRQDIQQISQAYMGKSELKVSTAVQKAVRSFLVAGSKASREQFTAAREALLSVQNDVYVELNEKHFPSFKKTDLYYKWMATESSAQKLTTAKKGGSAEAANTDNSWSSPMHPRREASQGPAVRLKQPDLRRAIASVVDLPNTLKPDKPATEQRRSLDGASVGRRPLFDDDDNASDDLVNSTHSLGSEPDSIAQADADQDQAVAAVQAALNDIVDEKPDRNTMAVDRIASPISDPVSPSSMRESFEFSGRSGATTTVSTPNRVSSPGQDKPSLSSLGLLGTGAQMTVFHKEDLCGEGEKLWEDGADDTGSGMKVDDQIQEAAPGDLGLAEVVQSLTLEINKLEAQQNILDTLTRKAELTGNAAELRILRKSKTSLDREIRRKELQRQQYIVQEADNNLYGRASISIKSIMIGTEEDGHEFALYVIEVQRQAGEKSAAVNWAIARRYSEFYELHKQLRAHYPVIKDLEFPRRQMVLTLQKDFLRKRRAALERYLRELLSRPQICRSIQFRAFLSQQVIRPIADTNDRQVDRQDFVTRIYNSVTDGMEEFLGNVPVLDQLSVAGQNLISAATALPASTLSNGGNTNASSALSSSWVNDPRTASEAEAEITSLETRTAGVVSFIQPICDIFLEIFQLNQGNNWLRGRALVVVLQQLLGGTIERKVRETFRSLMAEDAMVRHLDTVTGLLWPNGKFRTSPPIRTPEEKAKSRREAGLVLATLLPDVAGGVVGRGNAVQAGRRIFATLNNERLNQHLLYTILDEIVDKAFGIRV